MSLSTSREHRGQRHQFSVSIVKLSLTTDATRVGLSLLQNLKRINCLCFLDVRWMMVKEIDAAALIASLFPESEQTGGTVTNPSIPGGSTKRVGYPTRVPPTTSKNLRSGSVGLSFIKEAAVESDDEAKANLSTDISKSEGEKPVQLTNTSTKPRSTDTRLGSSGMTPRPFTITMRTAAEQQVMKTLVKGLHDEAKAFKQAKLVMPNLSAQSHDNLGDNTRADAMIADAFDATYIWMYESGEYEPQDQRDKRMYVFGELTKAVSSYPHLVLDLVDGDILELYYRIVKSSEVTSTDSIIRIQHELMNLKKLPSVAYATWYTSFADLINALRQNGQPPTEVWTRTIIIMAMESDKRYDVAIREVKLSQPALTLTQLHHRLELEAKVLKDLPSMTKPPAHANVADARGGGGGRGDRGGGRRTRGGRGGGRGGRRLRDYPADTDVTDLPNDPIRKGKGTCFNFRDNGKCDYGDGCRFSHQSKEGGGGTSDSPSKVRKEGDPPHPSRSRECEEWDGSKGSCSYGKTCKFLHGGKESHTCYMAEVAHLEDSNSYDEDQEEACFNALFDNEDDSDIELADNNDNFEDESHDESHEPETLDFVIIPTSPVAQRALDPVPPAVARTDVPTPVMRTVFREPVVSPLEVIFVPPYSSSVGTHSSYDWRNGSNAIQDWHQMTHMLAGSISVSEWHHLTLEMSKVIPELQYSGGEGESVTVRTLEPSKKRKGMSGKKMKTKVRSTDENKVFDPGIISKTSSPCNQLSTYTNANRTANSIFAIAATLFRTGTSLLGSRPKLVISIPDKVYAYMAGPRNSLSDIQAAVADSGATMHMLPNTVIYRRFIIEGTSFDYCTEIFTAKGTMYSSFMASVCIQSETPEKVQGQIFLKQVLFVTDLPRPLISIPALTDNGYVVRLDKKTCNVERGKNTIITMKREGRGLYLMSAACFRLGKEAVQANLANTFVGNDLMAVAHGRLGHSYKAYEAIEQITGTKANKENKSFCSACASTKITEVSFPHQSRHKPTRPLQHVYVDTCGPFQKRDPWKNRYFCLFVEAYYDYSTIYVQATKGELDQDIQDYISNAERIQQPSRLVNLHSDGATCSTEILTWLKLEGITLIPTAPDSSESNGKVERNLRTIQESGNAMRRHGGGPPGLTLPSFILANMIRNHLPRQKLRFSKKCPSRALTPVEEWEDFDAGSYEKLLAPFRVFLCEAFALVPDRRRRKGDARGERCVWVRPHEENRKTSLLYSLERPNKWIWCRSVVCNETCLPFVKGMKLPQQMSDRGLDNLVEESDEEEEDEDETSDKNEEIETDFEPPIKGGNDSGEPTKEKDPSRRQLDFRDIETTEPLEFPKAPSKRSKPMLTRSRKQRENDRGYMSRGGESPESLENGKVYVGVRCEYHLRGGCHVSPV